MTFSPAYAYPIDFPEAQYYGTARYPGNTVFANTTGNIIPNEYGLLARSGVGVVAGFVAYLLARKLKSNMAKGLIGVGGFGLGFLATGFIVAPKIVVDNTAPSQQPQAGTQQPAPPAQPPQSLPVPGDGFTAVSVPQGPAADIISQNSQQQQQQQQQQHQASQQQGITEDQVIGFLVNYIQPTAPQQVQDWDQNWVVGEMCSLFQSGRIIQHGQHANVAQKLRLQEQVVRQYEQATLDLMKSKGCKAVIKQALNKIKLGLTT